MERRPMRIEECGETLSTRECSLVLGISEPLLRDMIRKKEVHALKCGRIYKIPRRGIERLLDGSELTRATGEICEE